MSGARLALDESLERLAAMPEFLETAVEIVSREQARQRPAPEAFSLVEHACHLRDLEREGYLVRVRRMMAEMRPALAPFDGAAVAASRGYLAQDAHAAARDFAAARGELTRLLASLAAADLERAGTFGGREVRLADLVAMMLEHDREHRSEIERLMDVLEGRTAWK